MLCVAACEPNGFCLLVSGPLCVQHISTSVEANFEGITLHCKCSNPAHWPFTVALLHQPSSLLTPTIWGGALPTFLLRQLSRLTCWIHDAVIVRRLHAGGTHLMGYT